MLIERFTDAPPRPAPHRVRLAGYCIGALAAALFATPAASEIYFSDASVEVSGVGPRPSRNCTVLLRPAQTFGENAPRLTLVTSGAAQLSFGVEKPGQYSGLVIVQNNTRQPLVGADNASIEQFRVSDLGKAIRSQRLFFVTAQRSDSGKFVSSRYERIGFDAILAKVETACPFDAESLMTDLSARQRAEQALSISASDLVLIRWALTKKYSGSSTKPEPAASLSPQERAYLKRYAADSGLPLSQYLTTDTARKLIAEAQQTANPAPPPPSPPPPPPTRAFSIYDGTDFYGDDIEPSIMNYNFNDCRSACAGNAACRAFTFNKRRSVCILKTGTGEPRQSDEAISASTIPVSIPRVRLTYMYGIDLEKGDLELKGTKNVSLDQCADLCLNNRLCAGFSYIKSKNWCWMKKEILKRLRNDGVVSGIK